MRINIIGGGLAGTALAYMLKKHGATPVIYEASSSLAHGASGNDVGLYNPRFTAQKDVVGQYYADAFFLALEVFADFGDAIDWNPCGALHLITDEKKTRRYPKTVESWGWDKEDLCLVSADEASEIAGMDIRHDALYVRRSGTVSPQKLCHTYADGIEVHLNSPVHDLEALNGDATILACGAGILNFEETKTLPLILVRGQVSYVEADGISKNLRTALCYGGYIAPAYNNTHCIGATFQRHVCDNNVHPDDDIANIDKLHRYINALNGLKTIINSRAAVRVASKNYCPVVGRLKENLYISAAHGSHGILSALIAAKILADSLPDGRISKGYFFTPSYA